MMIPLGFFGSGVSADFELISSTFVGSSGTVSTVSFDVSALASKYKHLQIRWVATTGTANQSIFVRFNSDGAASSNYATHRLTAQGSSVISQSQTSTGAAYVFGTYNGTSATLPTSGITDILDFASTNKNKTVRSFAGLSATSTSTNEIGLYSHFWNSTAAITTVNWSLGGSTLNAGSRVSLYGIKG